MFTMLKNIAKKCSYYLLSKNVIKTQDIKIYAYGFELLISTILGMLSILIISLYFFDISYALIFFLFFMPLRTFTGGYHCKTYLNCFLFSNMYFVITVSISKLLNSLIISKLSFYSIIFITILFFFYSTPVYSLKTNLSQRAINNSKKISKLVIIIETATIIIGNTFHHDRCIFALLTMLLDALLMIITILDNLLTKYKQKEGEEDDLYCIKLCFSNSLFGCTIRCRICFCAAKLSTRDSRVFN